MTVDQAKAILARPKFGDPLCIEAAERLRDEVEAGRLRTILIGKWLDCIMCGYRGDKDCPMCKGEGKHVIGKELADSWDLDILQGVMEELEL